MARLRGCLASVLVVRQRDLLRKHKVAVVGLAGEVLLSLHSAIAVSLQ